jgi:glucokinase
MATSVLAGDIGGTKTDLAIYRFEEPRQATLVREETFPSRDYSGLGEIVLEFLGKQPQPLAAAAFGIAGPVLDGKVTATNLPWTLHEERLAEEIGSRRVRLLNDLETTAYGALFLQPEEFQVLNQGVPRKTHRVVIAAGTGLGQAILFWDGERFRPTATEGGHASFAPRNEREMALLRFLLRRFERVSWERLVSGPGLFHIFEYLDQEEGLPVSPEVRERMQAEDPSALIGEAAVAESCVCSAAAVDLFVSLYGAQAANLVLSVMALGGVYVGGGIVTKLLPRVTAGGFLEAFGAVGRFGPLVAETPVQIILNPKASLLGAAEVALDLVLEPRDATR